MEHGVTQLMLPFTSTCAPAGRVSIKTDFSLASACRLLKETATKTAKIDPNLGDSIRSPPLATSPVSPMAAPYTETPPEDNTHAVFLNMITSTPLWACR